MNETQKIWHPVCFDKGWNNAQTTEFDNLRPSWDKKRTELQSNREQYQQFMDRIKRKQAIDTGIIERMYDLDRGITETFITKGLMGEYLRHNDTNIEPKKLMGYLKDNFDAMDFVFNFINSTRNLTVGYIKELHALITRHQDTVTAIDQFGQKGEVPLLKGEFKKMPNNPTRADGVVCEYCPPVHVDAEMDNLIKIFHGEMQNVHVLVRAAFLHHTFVQIHPFQDGNGRIARLLASFVLIKDNLFPFALDRDKRTAYIDALEAADSGKYQDLVTLFADNQIESIKQALNLETVKETNVDSVLNVLSKKITSKNEAIKAANERILHNMNTIFGNIEKRVDSFKVNAQAKLGIDINVASCSRQDNTEHYFAHQIAQYAKKHHYYFNSSLPRRWIRIRMYFDDSHHYQIVLSLHHYGYDNNTLALGCFLEKEISADSQNAEREMLVPLGVPPLVFSSQTEIDKITEAISEQVDAMLTAALAYITEELS